MSSNSITVSDSISEPWLPGWETRSRPDQPGVPKDHLPQALISAGFVPVDAPGSGLWRLEQADAPVLKINESNDWLLLESARQPQVPGSLRGLLGCNDQAVGPARFVLKAHFEIRAATELPIFEQSPAPEEIRKAALNLGELIQISQTRAAEPARCTSGDTGCAEQATIQPRVGASERLPEWVKEIRWPGLRQRLTDAFADAAAGMSNGADRFSASIDAEGTTLQALIEPSAGGVRIEVGLGSWPALPQICFEALARLLLSVAGHVRCVRPVAFRDEAGLSVGLNVILGREAGAAHAEAALVALAVASQLTAQECLALAEEEFARTFLAIRGGGTP